MVYAKYARGYRQGGINFTNISVETWNPESVDAYEIGAKTSFRGKVSGYFNIAGFYNKLKGQQLFTALVTDPRSGLAGGAGIFNAGESRIQGVEVDASATLFDSLRLDVGYTYLDTKVISVKPVTAFYPYSAFIPLSNAGDPLTLSPKNRVTATATYTVPTDDSIGKISLAATFVHTDKQLANGSSNPTNKTDPAYGLGLGNLPATDILNLNLNWNKVLGSPVDAAVFVTNVTNEVYPVNVLGSLSTNGAEAQLMGMPRMFGFRLRYSFGQ
jgi:iron complex outermembrane receptor protein